MHPTGRRPTYSSSASKDIFPAASVPILGSAGEENTFPSRLKSLVIGNRLEDFQCLIQQQPGAWGRISPEELGHLLLEAVKKGHSSIVDELIAGSAPGKVAAIPMEMQLEMVEAARLQHNDVAKMSALLDALLGSADFPMHHLERLVQEGRNQRKYALQAELSTYRQTVVIKREQQYEYAIYDAAAAGNTAKLHKELDAKLGIPPLDNSLSGVDWFFNALHRWVAELFTSGAAKTLVNQQMGKVPLLHAAVASGDKETVLLLVKKGADLSALDRHGDTALSKARGQQSDEILNLLMKHHALDRTPVSGGVPAPVQVASGRIAAAVSPADATLVNRPGKDAATFRMLLTEAASALPQFQDLARELNANEPMSVAQAELLAAGYMANFQPPQASGDGRGRLKLPSPGSNAVHQLRSNSARFRLEGVRLEAFREKDVHRLLDSMSEATFENVLTLPDYIENNARSVGLCKLLITVVEQAFANATENRNWSSSSNERRKKLFTSCLRHALDQLGKTRTAMNGQDANETIQSQCYAARSHCSKITARLWRIRARSMPGTRQTFRITSGKWHLLLRNRMA
jgi:hypothetical protein